MNALPDRLSVSTATLGEIAARGVPVPTYDRTVRPRIAHVGIGGFHRAHMALYTDELAGAASTWRIGGLGLMDADRRMAEALSAQDHLYTLTEKASGASSPRVIGSIVDYTFAGADAARANDVIADQHLAILSLTITESGYAEPAAGETSTCDRIVTGLNERRQRGGAPITVLSCDNLPGNGDVTRRAIQNAASRHSDQLANWIETHCAFPNSMVDRITPATADADRDWLAQTFGIEDRWPVVAEPFRQWVMEDHFIVGRPEWDDVGVLFTNNVHAWELYKLRFLNAGHSCIAYLSALANIVFVDEAMATPAVKSFIDELLYTEALPTITEIAGHPREDYIAMVLGRFASTGVRDQIARLCMDGTAKYPTFLIPTIVSQLERGGPLRCSTLALAGWGRYLATIPESEQAFDASGSDARHAARSFLTDPLSFLEFDAVFPDALRNNARFRTEFQQAADLLSSTGPLSAMMGSS